MPAGDVPSAKAHKVHKGSDPLQLVFPHQYSSPNASCLIRVDDDVYDITAWKARHPGGEQLLDMFNNKDATDAFYALHSKDAIQQLKRMPKRAVADSDNIPRDLISRDFAELRRKLEREGWFERPWLTEIVYYVVPTFALLVTGWMISASHPMLAILLLALGMQQAGWLGHDWSHGRDFVPMNCGRFVAALSNSFSNAWWSNKHNTHHVFPNRIGIDSDIHNEPVLHLWQPGSATDVWYRRYQHYFFVFAYAFLYMSWKMQSLQFVLSGPRALWWERVPIVIHYALLLSMPWYVALGSVLLGGWFVAIVVTVNHQPEPLRPADSKYNFVVDQFETTRDVVCPDPFSEWFFGGMQYQLPHHLFPTMPRSRYPELRKVLIKWTEERSKRDGIEYKRSGIREIIRLNFEVMERAANAHN